MFVLSRDRFAHRHVRLLEGTIVAQMTIAEVGPYASCEFVPARGFRVHLPVGPRTSAYDGVILVSEENALPVARLGVELKLPDVEC